MVKLSYRKPKPQTEPANGALQAARANGLPVLLPKPQPKESPRIDEDTIEVTAVPTFDGAVQPTMVNGGSGQARALQPMVNGYGTHEAGMKAAHVPHPLSQKPMQAMDVS